MLELGTKKGEIYVIIELGKKNFIYRKSWE